MVMVCASRCSVPFDQFLSDFFRFKRFSVILWIACLCVCLFFCFLFVSVFLYLFVYSFISLGVFGGGGWGRGGGGGDWGCLILLACFCCLFPVIFVCFVACCFLLSLFFVNWIVVVCCLVLVPLFFGRREGGNIPLRRTRTLPIFSNKNKKNYTKKM